MTKKLISTITAVTVVSCSPLSAGTSLKDDLKKNADKPIQLDPKEVLQKHSKESKVVAKDQDELAADVQDLIQDQTDNKVIELLEQAELLMGEATELLEEENTDGNTIAIETEIIEKIYEAAKQKKQQSQPGEGQGPPDPMLERMEQMMGKEPGDKPGDQPGQGGEGDSPGQGGTGDSDKANDNKTGDSDNTKEERTVPKNTTAPSKTLPREEQRALDAYKKATSQK